jgi:hypothetical protein
LTPRASLTLWPAGVAHYTFLAACTEAGRRERPQLCADAKGVERDTIHRRTAERAVQFFDKTLK